METEDLFSGTEMQRRLSSESAQRKLALLVGDVAYDIASSSMAIADIKRLSRGLLGMREHQGLRKAEYCEELARCLCSPRRFSAYFATLNQAEQDVLVRIAFSWGISSRQVFGSLGISAKELHGYWSIPFSVLERLPLSCAVHYDRVDCYAGESVRQCLAIQLEGHRPPMRTVTHEEMAQMPGYFSAGQGLEFFEAAHQVIQVLQDSRCFDKPSGSAVLKGTLGKLGALRAFSPFTTAEQWAGGAEASGDNAAEPFAYTKKQAAAFGTARLMLATAFLTAALTPSGHTKADLSAVPVDPLELYRSLMQTFFASQNFAYDLKFMYPHLSSEKPYGWEETMARHRLHSFSRFLDTMRTHAPQEPVWFRDFVDRMDGMGFPPPATGRLLYRGDFCSASYGYYDDSVYIERGRRETGSPCYYRAMLYEPAYTNLFLALSAMGLFEITWEPSAGIPRSPDDSAPEEMANWQNDAAFYRWGRIGYIQVTPLGKYALGISDTFDAPGIRTFAPPVLDAESPIVRIEQGDRTTELFLESFCRRLSPTLYKAELERVVKACRTSQDVDALFRTLAERSKESLPAAWNLLRDEAKSRFVTLRAESGWLVLSMDGMPARLATGLESLCRMGFARRMEGHAVAVRSTNLEFLLRNLEQSGFSLEVSTT